MGHPLFGKIGSSRTSSEDNGLTVTVTKVKDDYVVSKKRDGRIIRQSHPLGEDAANSLAEGWKE
jgi:hypothetical protein